MKDEVYQSLLIGREQRRTLLRHYFKFKNMTAIEISRVYDIPVYKVRKILDKANVPYKKPEVINDTRPM